MASSDPRHKKRSTAQHSSSAMACLQDGYIHTPLETTNHSTEHERRRQRRLDNECMQFLRVQQKLTGRKTTAEYARIRLVHRQDEMSRKRNLHQNGTTNFHLNGTTKATQGAVTDGTKANRDVRPYTARDSSPSEEASSRKTSSRPQSARPSSRQSMDAQIGSLVAGQRVSVALLERCYYNPIPLTTHLSASKSAPRLQAALQYSTTSSGKKHQHEQQPKHPTARTVETSPSVGQTVETEGQSRRQRIVVNMRHLEIRECDDEDAPSVAASSMPGQAQRHERQRNDTEHTLRPGRSVWGEFD